MLDLPAQPIVDGEHTPMGGLPNSVAGPIGDVIEACLYSSCEPFRLKALVVEPQDTCRDALVTALTHLVAWEPLLTTAASPTIAKFCLSADEFDLLVLGPGIRDEQASELVATVGDAWPILVVTSATGRKVASRRGASSTVFRVSFEQLSERRMAGAIGRGLAAHARRCSQHEAPRRPLAPRKLSSEPIG